MKKIYSVWAREGENIGHCLKEGEGPLCFPDGEIDEECEVRLYTFEAETHEEAMSIYYLRQGWAPYKPEGDSEHCPNCKANFYPKGSGECWNCGYNVYKA